jgi:hypothetical protein
MTRIRKRPDPALSTALGRAPILTRAGLGTPQTWFASSLLLLTVSAVLLVAPRADAQRRPRLLLSPPSASVGGSVVARGIGFPSRRKGFIALGSRRVASFVTGRRGAFSLRFIVPPGSGGWIDVTARSRAGRRRRASRATARLHVVSRSRGLNPASSRVNGTAGSPAGGLGGTAGGYWVPAQHTTWQWQLTTPVDQSVNAQMYDIDLFDNSAAVVAALHAQGRKVVCYVNAGTYENWRPDAGSFPAAVRGKSNGWPGEQWLDISQLSVLEPIMSARLDLCKQKGFDAVEPDNIDGYQNSTGFALTASQQLTYNQWLAGAAHARGLSVGLKNDPGQASQLEPSFDWSLDEQCFQFSECGALLPFITAHKAVFEVEYSLDPSQFCSQANAMGFMSMKKNVNLDASRATCF